MELSVRQAYFRVQYALKQLVLTSDLLKLSSAQSRDIDLRFHAGSSSKLDQIQARRDVTTNRLRFQEAQNALASAFRDLLVLTGEPKMMDTSVPAPVELLKDYPRDLPYAHAAAGRKSGPQWLLMNC